MLISVIIYAPCLSFIKTPTFEPQAIVTFLWYFDSPLNSCHSHSGVNDVQIENVLKNKWMETNRRQRDEKGAPVDLFVTVKCPCLVCWKVISDPEVKLYDSCFCGIFPQLASHDNVNLPLCCLCCRPFEWGWEQSAPLAVRDVIYMERQREVEDKASEEVKCSSLSLPVPALYRCFTLLCFTPHNGCHRPSSPNNDTMIPERRLERGVLAGRIVQFH